MKKIVTQDPNDPDRWIDVEDPSHEGLIDALQLLGLRARKEWFEIAAAYDDLPRSELAKKLNASDVDHLTLMLIELRGRLWGLRRPDATTGLLSRLIDALEDLNVGAKPVLFDVEPKYGMQLPGLKPTGSTAAAHSEGCAAFAAELLASAGMAQPSIIAWLDRKARELVLNDRDGNPIDGRRIAEWRRNFRKGSGSKGGIWTFEYLTERERALLRSPRSDLKTARCREVAERVICNLSLARPNFVPVRNLK